PCAGHCFAINGGYYVTFDTDGGSEISKQKLSYGDLVEVPETPVKPGYEFVHWVTSEDEYLAEEWNFAENKVETDITLYAVWQPAAMTVKFDLDGGSFPDVEAVMEKQVVFGETYGELPVPEKEGHVFDGWVYSQQWFSETTLHESGAVQEVVDLLTEKGMTYEKDGAIWLKTTEFGEEKDEVLIRSNGIPTYFAADIAYHKNKYDRGFKRVINIWGADHHGHVARMKRSMDAIGYNGDDLTVLLMQLVRLYQNGEVVRMSKRTGQYVTLQELIEDVGKDAARYFFIMRNPDSHLDFDLDLAKQQSSDNPVYYVQYAHARINSILKATGKAAPKAAECDLTVLKEEAELELIRKIANLPTEIAYAAEQLEPYRMARYATELATLFHSFYNSCRVINEDDAVLTNARLVLVNAARITLRNVLTMLGVSAPERM
ncbi:MAG: arginine--tRNA ligase, partial [Peptococcaceae bacterium]|nr:arginine--tRNA ligase [Peptococcaceae bacterium]